MPQFSKIYDKVKADAGAGGDEAFRNSKVAKKQDEPPAIDTPITFSYKPHGGPVLAVAASPMQSNLFVSCGADCTLRLHNSYSAASIQSFEPSSSYLYSAAWSTTRQLVFATGGGKGKVYIYDMMTSSHLPVSTLDMPGGSNVYSLAFNRGGDNSPHMIAAGEGTGAVRVWKVAKSLAEPLPGERDKAAGWGSKWT